MPSPRTPNPEPQTPIFRLTREVRFAVNTVPDEQLDGKPTNSFGGFPSLTGLGHYFTLRATLVGPLDSTSRYLRNIKEVDRAVRTHAIPFVDRAVRDGTFGAGSGVVRQLFDLLKNRWPGARLEQLSLALSPFQSWRVLAEELPMVRLSQKFEFSASHRLHNPGLSDEVNVQTYGKCNNPNGHGHNYELQVTLAGTPSASGVIVDVPTMERVVNEAVIDRFDHKNLNLELPEFKDVIPTVENIAMTIYQLLKPRFASLASVTVWETPKTWCEYSES
jgi:6-pyruvoyltetrahydropterin/6-carboxytetrahydropterin synthase